MSSLTLFIKKKSLINQFSMGISLIIVAFTLIIFTTNFYFFKFRPIEYFSPKLLVFSLINLSLIYSGLRLLLPKNHKVTEKLVHFSVIFLLVTLIALFTSAIQLTPFTPIDKYLVVIDNYLGINTPKLLEFTYRHTPLEQLFNFAYSMLTPEITFTMLLNLFFYNKKYQDQFIFLLLSSAVIGFSFYYFFPTTAPASMFQSPFFLEEQHKTYIKFQLLHHHLPTHQMIEGGLIAMPSFHCIWALICQYILYIRNKGLSLLVLPLNIALITSCLLLGWHYFIDIIVSIILVFFLIFSAKKLYK